MLLKSTTCKFLFAQVSSIVPHDSGWKIYILEELKCFEQREWNSKDFDAVVWLLCHTWLGYPLHVGQVLSSPLYSGQRDAIISHHDHYTFRAGSSPLSKLIKK